MRKHSALMNTLEERVQRALREDVTIVPYDAAWPELFRQEAEHLRACLPPHSSGASNTLAARQFPASPRSRSLTCSWK